MLTSVVYNSVMFLFTPGLHGISCSFLLNIKRSIDKSSFAVKNGRGEKARVLGVPWGNPLSNHRAGFLNKSACFKDCLIPERWLVERNRSSQSLKWQALSWPWSPAPLHINWQSPETSTLKGTEEEFQAKVETTKTAASTHTHTQKDRHRERKGRRQPAKPAIYVARRNRNSPIYFTHQALGAKTTNGFWLRSRLSPRQR